MQFTNPYVLHAGAPNVTELTFDRESRTLTCTSTGGPATTVTWTKDGAVITPNTTHQQTKMIVDAVEGTYQNTLTIAQSVTGDNLYGLYSCMLENSRGSSNRTTYIYSKHVTSSMMQACSILFLLSYVLLLKSLHLGQAANLIVMFLIAIHAYSYFNCPCGLCIMSVLPSK